MDSIGNCQMDIPDVEAGFPSSRVAPREVDVFIRNMTDYIRNKGGIIKDGDTADGGSTNLVWKGKHVDRGICDPPRPVVRFLPTGRTDIPEGISPEKTILK